MAKSQNLYDDEFTFDEKQERDPADRALVDRFKQYVKELGGTVKEIDFNGSTAPTYAHFIIGWDKKYVTLLKCVGSRAGFFSITDLDSEIVPPVFVKDFHHLRMVWTAGYSYGADLSWLKSIKGIESLIVTPGTIGQFPESLACTSTLQELQLKYHSDDIDRIPNVVQQLTELRRIYIRQRDNRSPIYLPDWLGELPKLERIRLAGLFHSIPYSLVQTGLPFTSNYKVQRGIILSNVTLEEGDVSMYLSNDRALIDAFYSGEQTTEADPMRECKVIFLGDGGAGKSSLIERMMEDTFALGKHATEGMRVIPWDTELDGKPFRLRILDFGGQEIMHSMHRCFLSAHTVYVVVCAVRDDTEIDSAVTRWLEQVKSYAPDCPVILVLNKMDENPGAAVNEADLKNRYRTLKAVLKTSATVKLGGQYSAASLIEAIMNHVSGCVQGWRGNKGMLTVKRALEDMGKQKKPYIKSEEYRKLCEDNGVKGDKLQRSMLEWFRDLGVAYFYERKAYDLRLESLRVLDPVWLTNGIYRLILRAGKKVNHGVITHEAIRDVLSKSYRGDAREDVTYSAEESEFVLHVMRMFEISHEMEEGRELVPMLMEKNTPPTAKKYHQPDALHLRWEGAFLPNNLIHKLMIQKFSELDRNCMWRTGAGFHAPDGGCMALASMDDHALDVYVSGGDSGAQREYLKTFRDRVWAILESLNLRETKELICCTVSGKEGKIPRAMVERAYRHGDESVMMPDSLEYVSPGELLRAVDADPQFEREAVPRTVRQDTPPKKSLTEKIKDFLDIADKSVGIVPKLVIGGLFIFGLVTGVFGLKEFILHLFGFGS